MLVSIALPRVRARSSAIQTKVHFPLLAKRGIRYANVNTKNCIVEGEKPHALAFKQDLVSQCSRRDLTCAESGRSDRKAAICDMKPRNGTLTSRRGPLSFDTLNSSLRDSVVAMLQSVETRDVTGIVCKFECGECHDDEGTQSRNHRAIRFRSPPSADEDRFRP